MEAAFKTTCTHYHRGALAPLLVFIRLSAVFVLFAFATPQGALALGQREPLHTAGFRSMPLWDEERNFHLEVGIWYPSHRQEVQLNIQDWTLSVAPNAKEAPGSFPLVLISHDAGGGMFSYADTAADLARQGFVVVAPTHGLDNFADSSGIFTAGQILNRPKELAFILTALRGTGSLSFIDYERLGVLGAGSGAATALSFAGATPDFKAYRDYCANAGAAEPYCSSIAQDHMGEISALPPSAFDFPRPRICALALAAPACGMFFTREGLAAVRQPVLIFTPKTDSINNAVAHSELLKRNLPLPPAVIRLDKEDSTDLLTPCAEGILDFDGLSCPPPDEDALKQRQHDFHAPLTAFFKNLLGEPGPTPLKPMH